MDEDKRVNEDEVSRDVDVTLCALVSVITLLIILAGLADRFWHLLF